LGIDEAHYVANIYTLNISSFKKITHFTDTYAPNPRWSPDSEWLTFSAFYYYALPQFRDIFIVPSDGSDDPINLTNDTIMDFSPDWSPVLKQQSSLVFLPIINKQQIPTPPPVLRIEGYVRLDAGSGVENVNIHFSMSPRPSPGRLVATTDLNGYYWAELSCPLGHDETFLVHPVLEGYIFEPEWGFGRTSGQCRTWIHYFTAIPAP